MGVGGQENPWRRGFLEPQPVKCVPWLLTTDTSDCTYHCSRTSSPVSQSNKRNVAPRKIKKPLAVVPLHAIYVLSKNSPRSLNIQVELNVRAHLRPGTYHILVLTELQRICGTGAQGDGSLLNALSRKCYMRMLQYVHRGTLP